MASLYDAYDKKLDKQGLGWADKWNYKYNNKHGLEGRDSEKVSNKEKLAKMKQAASSGVDKTKQAVTSGAQKVKSGTTNGIRWIKENVHRKPTGPQFDGA